jgi:hypothetical protein
MAYPIEIEFELKLNYKQFDRTDSEMEFSQRVLLLIFI